MSQTSEKSVSKPSQEMKKTQSNPSQEMKKKDASASQGPSIVQKSKQSARKSYEYLKANIRNDFALKGPGVTIIKWIFISLVSFWILLSFMSSIITTDTILKYINKIITSLLLLLQFCLSLYVVYNDYDKLFFKKDKKPSLFDKYRTLLVWLCLVNLFTIPVTIYHSVNDSVND